MAITSSYPQHPVLSPRERRHDQIARKRPSPRPDRGCRPTARMRDNLRSCRWVEHALGAAAQQILQSIEGPVTKIMAVIIIIVTGLTLAFGDTSGGFRRLVQILFGLSIAFAASSFFLSFFSFGGGALV